MALSCVIMWSHFVGLTVPDPISSAVRQTVSSTGLFPEVAPSFPVQLAPPATELYISCDVTQR